MWTLPEDFEGGSVHPPGEKEPSRRAVAIGASAGAIDALSKILPQLPTDFPLPIMVVVHLPPDRATMLPEIFAARCAVRVKEAEDKEEIMGGTVYFAPPNYHLLVEPDYRLSLSSDEPVLYSRPSIDVLLETAADVFGDGLIGIVLTGANSDGAKGLRAVIGAGGMGWAQNPATAEMAAMPEAALQMNPGAKRMTLPEMVRNLTVLRQHNGLG
jgi:two-component system chemotaxis response regulator CheB